MIKVNHVSKKFAKNLNYLIKYGLTDISKSVLGLNTHSHKLRPHEFWAVNNISFQLKKGEALGLIGPNGSGKTTLLKMLNGILTPDKGTITVKGKVSALIEVGAGFHPLLTGKENIWINGTILGMTKKELDEKYQQIVDFAGIGEFIDAPVRTYSSGMFVRLGFAIAVHANPDILLIDEILAVGDKQFQLKCFNKITEFKKNCSLVLVSHSMANIARLCDRVIVLNQAQVVYNGQINKGIKVYSSLSSQDLNSCVETTSGFQLHQFQLQPAVVNWNQKLSFRAKIKAPDKIKNCRVRLAILSQSGQVVAEWRSEQYGNQYDLKKGENIITGQLPELKLRADKYFVSFILNPQDSFKYLISAHAYAKLSVKKGIFGNAVYQI